MLESSNKKLVPASVGKFVALSVPKVDRGPFDSRNLIGKIMKVENDIYQIGTKHGIIKNWFSRNDFRLSGASVIGDIPSIQLSLREAVPKESKFGGQGHSFCNCKVSKKQCHTKRCSCFKAVVLCNSRCH